MIKHNRHLEKIGIKKNDFPFDRHALDDPRYQEDEDGFSEAEFFNLDYTLKLVIYSYLKEFEENYSHFGHPACFTSKQWKRILHSMVEGFRLDIKYSGEWNLERSHPDVQAKINRGRKLFIKYLECLWW